MRDVSSASTLALDHAQGIPEEVRGVARKLARNRLKRLVVFFLVASLAVQAASIAVVLARPAQKLYIPDSRLVHPIEMPEGAVQNESDT